MSRTTENYIRKPDWLKIKLPTGKTYAGIKEIVSKNKLHTICESGNCPNIGECWGAGTATFMILGEICTRSCKFCAVKTGKPLSPDHNEPVRIAESVKIMKLKHAVITSVNRDDLPDGGADIWANTIKTIKSLCQDTTIESLIPDFNGDISCLDKIIGAHSDIVSHNLETVKRLTPVVRNRAKYDRSLDVLEYLKKNKVVTKSGIMVGIGESDTEIYEVMDDLLNVGCDIMTIGQYLQPTKLHLPVKRYITPEEFNNFKTIGLQKGFRIVESAPMVRSSFHAEKHLPNK